MKALKGLLVEHEVPFVHDACSLLEERFADLDLEVRITPCVSPEEAKQVLLGPRRRAYDFVVTDMYFPPVGNPDAQQSRHSTRGRDVIAAAKSAKVRVIIGYTQVGPPTFQSLRANARSDGATGFYQRDDLIVSMEESEIREMARLLRENLLEVDSQESGPEMPVQVDKRSVAVVHGANIKARNAIFEFLRSLGLEPVEFETAVNWTENGSPPVPDVLQQLFHRTQAVVVLLTPDEHVELHSAIADQRGGDGEKGLQSRPNVYFEAGMAFAVNPSRTILVKLGRTRDASDLARHAIHIDDSPQKREALTARLVTAGCEVKRGADAFAAGKFSAAVKGIS